MKFSEYSKRNKIMLVLSLLLFSITTIWSILAVFAREMLPAGWITSIVPIISLGLGLILMVIVLIEEVVKYNSNKAK